MVASGGIDLMWALSEVGAMVQKAARGAGIPLGQAEDLGRVAVYLTGTGGDVSLITEALKEPLSKIDVRWGDECIDVRSGPASLIGPVVRDAFQMGIDKAELVHSGHAPLILAFLSQSGLSASLTDRVLKRNDAISGKVPKGPVTIPDNDWAAWAALAAHTYVPESDASRVAGAGAGLTDND